MNLELDPSVPWVTMFDDTNVSLLPAGDFAYAGYVNGNWPTFAELEAKFPGHRLLDIAVSASADATCLDIENGDATIEQAPDWVKRQLVRGVYRPVLYVEASMMKALEQYMASNNLPRLAYRLWTAHYLLKAHLCSPWSCGYGISEADGTQWTDRALGRSLDQSVLNPEFFDVPAPKPAPKPVPAPAPAPEAWQEATMNKLPTLQQGSADTPGHVYFVHRAQALIQVIAKINNIAGAKDLVIDGNFGAATKDGLEAVQHHFGLTEDGVCGPATWALLVSGWSA